MPSSRTPESTHSFVTSSTVESISLVSAPPIAGPSRNLDPKTPLDNKLLGVDPSRRSFWLQQIKRRNDQPKQDQSLTSSDKTNGSTKTARRNKSRRAARKLAIERRLWTNGIDPKVVENLENRIRHLNRRARYQFQEGLTRSKEASLAEKAKFEGSSKIRELARKHFERAEFRAGAAIKTRNSLDLYRKKDTTAASKVPTIIEIKEYLHKLMNFK